MTRPFLSAKSVACETNKIAVILGCIMFCRDNELCAGTLQIGGPQLDVQKEDILALKKLNYSWTKVARLLGISRQTLYRRLEEFDISESFTEISSSDLDQLLQEIKAEHPNSGEVMLNGYLLERGVKISRATLRSAIHRVDHANTVSRKSLVIKRRVYNVSHPNALWHIDGNHK